MEWIYLLGQQQPAPVPAALTLKDWIPFIAGLVTSLIALGGVLWVAIHTQKKSYDTQHSIEERKHKEAKLIRLKERYASWASACNNYILLIREQQNTEAVVGHPSNEVDEISDYGEQLKEQSKLQYHLALLALEEDQSQPAPQARFNIAATTMVSILSRDNNVDDKEQTMVAALIALGSHFK